jgi:hypothetical protein
MHDSGVGQNVLWKTIDQIRHVSDTIEVVRCNCTPVSSSEQTINLMTRRVFVTPPDTLRELEAIFEAEDVRGGGGGGESSAASSSRSRRASSAAPPPSAFAAVPSSSASSALRDSYRRTASSPSLFAASSSISSSSSSASVAAAHDDDDDCVPLSVLSDALLNCNGVYHFLSALLLHCLDQIGCWRDERANGGGREGGGDVDGGRRQQSANHEQRQRVYAFMSLPWRFEKFVRMGWCVCLDAFLFPLTVLPLRVLFLLPRLALCRRPCVRDCCDLMRFALLAACVATLFWYDISSLYHWIRVQAPIKLYVLFNMLQVCGRHLHFSSVCAFCVSS